MNIPIFCENVGESIKESVSCESAPQLLETGQFFRVQYKSPNSTVRAAFLIVVRPHGRCTDILLSCVVIVIRLTNCPCGVFVVVIVIRLSD